MAADIRVDALAKVTGGEKFPTDLAMPGMVYGRVVWAQYPHALIRSIDAERARRMPGVVCVLTHRDIPGQKVCGRLVPDRPVLCADKVRYLGDAVALVAATDPAAADRAAAAVNVDYLPLPVVDDPEAAMAADAPRVHEGGNVAAHLVVSRGDVGSVWDRAAVVVENTYRTPRQMPAFLETEGGLAYPESDGSLVICCGSQAGNVNRAQIACALALPEEKVRVISSPLGGGFGGKDDITVEIYLALLCRATGRPVRLVLTREESIRFGIKRHPMVIRMKTAASRDGTLLAHLVHIVADTGAYLSLGRSVLWLAMEHCTGPYRIPNLHVEGFSVYTNNGVAGACRGFGVNQVAFAVESQMDAIARALGMDPLHLRERNALREGDEGPLGQRLEGGVGIGETIRLVRESELYRNRDRWRAASTWRKKVGVGVACAFKSVGFGLGLPERGVARITVLPGPRFQACVSYEEMGQGSRTAFARIAASALGCPVELVEVVVGDTARVPAGGATSASRGTYLGGGALWAAARDLQDRLRLLAGGAGGASSCYDLVRALGDVAWGVSGEGTFDPPKPEEGIPGVAGIPHSVFSYMTQAALVEVDTLTGAVRLKETVAAVDAGRVISRAGVVGQVEGGTVMGMGMALTEDVVMERGYYRTESLADYPVPYALDAPRTTVLLADVPCSVSPLGAKGVGELGAIAITPACTNAICDAVGVRVTGLPARPEVILKLLAERGKGET